MNIWNNDTRNLTSNNSKGDKVPSMSIRIDDPVPLKRKGKVQRTKLKLHWNSLVLVVIQIKDTSITDKQQVNT